MSTIIDRLSHELESIGRRAQAALDEGKLQIELMRLRRQRDGVARELGFFVHRKERQGDVEQARIDAQMLKLDDLDLEIASLERQLAAARAEGTSVDEMPAPPAEPVPAEEVPVSPAAP
jgi:multidrug efflux pump subunit AcrA (membrane-fusion protein)